MSNHRPSQSAAARAATPEGSLGILVIDDEPAIRALVQLGLQEQGLAVWTADGGTQGVEVYRAYQTRIGIVLLDVKMPGLDGPRTLPLLRQVNPEVCCCFVTGDTGVYDEEELLRLGAVKVLRKPFSLSQLSKLLKEMLARLAESGQAERRRAPRCAHEGDCAWFFHDDAPGKARIHNVSVGGISLLLECPPEPGAILHLELHSGERHSLPVRVVHVAPSADAGEWLVGCAFTDRLADAELEALLAGAAT